MPTLVLLRHGKAEAQPEPGLADRDRQLAQRGWRDSEAAGGALAAAGFGIDHAVVSPAVRARQTWDAFAKGFKTEVPQSQDRRIYDATVMDLFAVISETPDSVASLILVGHNPSVAELVARLDEDDEIGEYGFPTAAFAAFEMGSAWENVDMSASRLLKYWSPRA